jgi:hypothetical protein
MGLSQGSTYIPRPNVSMHHKDKEADPFKTSHWR